MRCYKNLTIRNELCQVSTGSLKMKAVLIAAVVCLVVFAEAGWGVDATAPRCPATCPIFCPWGRITVNWCRTCQCCPPPRCRRNPCHRNARGCLVCRCPGG